MESASTRRSVRLDGYDYTIDGAYFITICTQHKEYRFGHITDGKMVLNEAGTMVTERIQAITDKFPGTLVDVYVVMPNHIHFILTLLGYNPNGGYVGAAPRGRPLSDRQGRSGTLPVNDDIHDAKPSPEIPDDSDWLAFSGPVGPKTGGHEGPPLHVNDLGIDHNDPVVNISDHASNVPSVSDVVGWLKASTTNYYIKGVKEGRYPAFDRRLWQRNYYEHIIRTELAYNQIDEYIRTNPLHWYEDRLR